MKLIKYLFNICIFFEFTYMCSYFLDSSRIILNTDGLID